MAAKQSLFYCMPPRAIVPEIPPSGTAAYSFSPALFYHGILHAIQLLLILPGALNLHFMRKLLTLLTLPVILFACKKDKGGVDTTDVRILKVIDTDIASGNTSTAIFDYDQSGKITKVSATYNGNTNVVAEITYQGPDIIITPMAIHNGSLDATYETRYTVDPTGKPLKRIVSNMYSINDPSQPQKTFEKDTAIFEYNSAGVLSKMTGGHLDSTWYNPGVPQIMSSYSSSVANFTQAGNDLAQIIRNVTKVNRTKNGAAPFVTSSSATEEKYTYEYSKGYVNKTDFSNAVVFSEFSSLTSSDWPMQQTYAHIPDKVTGTAVERELPAGNIISNDTWTQQATKVGYNSFGFISTIDIDFGAGAGKAKKEIIYNK
jgi:hypothetical protein